MRLLFSSSLFPIKGFSIPYNVLYTIVDFELTQKVKKNAPQPSTGILHQNSRKKHVMTMPPAIPRSIATAANMYDIFFNLLIYSKSSKDESILRYASHLGHTIIFSPSSFKTRHISSGLNIGLLHISQSARTCRIILLRLIYTNFTLLYTFGLILSTIRDICTADITALSDNDRELVLRLIDALRREK